MVTLIVDKLKRQQCENLILVSYRHQEPEPKIIANMQWTTLRTSVNKNVMLLIEATG